jgi:hypothetical protein
VPCASPLAEFNDATPAIYVVIVLPGWIIGADAMISFVNVADPQSNSKTTGTSVPAATPAGLNVNVVLMRPVWPSD